VYAMSLLPPQHSVPVLTKIAERYRDTRGHLGYAYRDAVVLLTVVGGQRNLKLLKAFDDAGRIHHAIFRDTSYHDYVARLEQRLSMTDMERRGGRTREELLYWQCSSDQPVGRVPCKSLFRAARRHRKYGVRISTDFLRSRLPERYAIAVAAVQNEEALIPGLRALAAKKNSAAVYAMRATQYALKMIGSASQTRPSGSDTDAR